jgi:hypothetical protein
MYLPKAKKKDPNALLLPSLMQLLVGAAGEIGDEDEALLAAP